MSIFFKTEPLQNIVICFFQIIVGENGMKLSNLQM